PISCTICPVVKFSASDRELDEGASDDGDKKGLLTNGGATHARRDHVDTVPRAPMARGRVYVTGHAHASRDVSPTVPARTARISCVSQMRSECEGPAPPPRRKDCLN